MASHKHDTSSESNVKAAKVDSCKHTVSAKGSDLNELQEEVEEMCKGFLVSPTSVVDPKHSGSGREAQPRHPLRSSSRPPGKQQAAARKQNPSSRKFQPRVYRPKVKPEWKKIEDLVRCMQKILKRAQYKGDVRLSLEDAMNVRSVFNHHPKARKKTRPGIDHFKVKKSTIDGITRCFSVVRTDGTEFDFSYHLCLKVKAAGECPDLLEHYDILFRDYTKRDADRAQRQANKVESAST